MAIDLRAYVYCSLGPLVSADIADDYIQDSGLIRYRGSAVIKGIITPDVGSVVDFGYAKNGRLARVPRRMRVLSSSANPYTGLTTLEIGCLLTYKQDYKQPEEALLKSVNDPEGIIDVPLSARQYLPPYISANWIFATCMQRLGITGSAALTNIFIAEEFSLDAPYVEIISNLLKSECKFGYLDVNEVLQVRSLYDTNTEGPLYDDNSIIEIESIGVGELPGEAVYVPFASRRLKPPENNNPTENQLERINWEFSERISTSTIYLTTKNGTVPYSVLERTVERTKYKVIPIYRRTKTTAKSLDGSSNIIDIEVETNVYEKVEDKEVVEVTISEKELPVVRVLGNLATSKIDVGINFPNYSVFEKTVQTFFYDKEGNETQSISETYESESALVGKMNILTSYKEIIPPSGSSAIVFIDTPGVEANILTRKEVNTREKVGEYQQSITDTYVHFIDTQEGQQAIATGTQKVRTKDEADTFISNAIKSGLVLQGTNIERRRTGKDTAQTRPNAAERAAEKTTKTLKETIDGLTIETPKLEFVYGGITSQTFIEFAMPYMPDDYFIVTGTPPSQSIAIIPSDARQKAINYGIIQNRLRLANRAGINIKVAPEVVPTAPYSPCYVKAAGTTGHFRVNGTTWSMSASGIACGVDLLYWGAVGQDTGGTNWLPIAPGITTLPTTPPITIGTSPVPAMSVEIPEEFDLQNPDLEELFDSILPTSGDPVYPNSIEPSVTIPPYNLILPHIGRISLTPVARIAAPANVFEPVAAGISIYNSYQSDDAVLLLNFEGTTGSKLITDTSIYQHEPAAVDGAAALAAGGKTGQSFYFVPLSDYLPSDPETGSEIRYEQNIFEPGYGDFTIECWLNLTERPRLTDVDGTYKILEFYYSFGYASGYLTGRLEIEDLNYSEAVGDWSLSGTVAIYTGSFIPTTAVSFDISINDNFAVNQWHHLALVRLDGYLTIYLDGEAIGTEDWSDVDFRNQGDPNAINYYNDLLIANRYNSNIENWTGGIDGFGMYHRAKYTEPFTPSTRLFRKISGPAIAPQLFLEGTSYDSQWTTADLVKEGVLLADGASLTLTAQDAETQRLPHRLEADNGSILVNGSNAGLVPALLMAATGSLALTGFDAKPDDPHFYRVSALLKMEGPNNSTTFIDSSLNNIAITTNGNAKITTTSPKFGNSCATFDGAGDYLSTASSQLFNVGGIPFTVECWIKPTNTTQTSRPIFGQRITGTFAPFEIRVNGTGMSWLIANASITAWSSTASSATGLLVAGNWHHIAFVGTGSNLTLYVNGTSRLTLAQPSWTSASRQLFIGFGGQTSGLIGEIDEFRFTKFFARYTANFTPPTQEFLSS